MHYVGWSRIYCRPSLFVVLWHKQEQITNKFTSIIQTFSFFMSVAEQDIQRIVHASAPMICAKVPMVFMFDKLQYSMPGTLLYYITIQIQYFIFFVFFFCFLYHTQTEI